MSTTLRKEIIGVKDFLGNPLSQFPSVREILAEMEMEYQFITNRLNNTGNAWLVDEYVVTAVEGQLDYRLDVNIQNFFKALSITTVPEGAVITQPGALKGVDISYALSSNDAREEPLELVELESYPNEYAWVKGAQGQLFGDTDNAMFAATYRQIFSTGEAIYLHLRPQPKAGTKYKILYQVTDWWSKLFTAANTLNQDLPNSSQRGYIRALVAQNLIGKGVVKWSLNRQENEQRAKWVMQGLDTKLDRYSKAFNEYLDSLDNPDITYIESWADSVGL